MSFDFPNSPTEGQTYLPAGGPQYVYSAGAWRMLNPSQSGTAQTRNRIVNGAMQISQENGDTTSPIVSSGGWYGADQWQSAWSFSPGTAQQSRNATISPNGSQRVLYHAIGTAKPSFGATDYLFIEQKIEGTRVADFQWGTASAKQVILRFWIWAQVAGTYSIQLQNSAADRSYIAGFTVAAGEASTWKQVSLVIPGDTTGTWLKDTGIGMILRFVWAAGSTNIGVAGWQAGNKTGLTGQSNGAATGSTSFLLADVGLYLDPQNTGLPPPWVMPDEAAELAACQRYYERCPDAVIFHANIWATHYLKVNKRTTPAIALSVGGAGATQGYPMGFHTTYAATTGAAWTANARM